MDASYGPPPSGAPEPTGPVAPAGGGAVGRVRAARADRTQVLLEGVHALKHAVRFGAAVSAVVTPDPEALHGLLAALAPDVRLPVDVTAVDAGTWRALAGRELPSPVLAVAARPQARPADVISCAGLVVALEEPRHLGNLGAVVRVAAAAGADGLIVVGAADPWHPTAVRAAAGLQFALRVARCDELPATDRPVVALDPAGTPLRAGAVPSDAVLVVGTERGGLSADLAARADTTLAVPMRPGVSSLNLATAVAAALYGGAGAPAGS